VVACDVDPDDDGVNELVANAGDCDDLNNSVHPGAAEVCNGIDDDCDVAKDEGITIRYYRDADVDTFGNIAVFQDVCSAPAGYILDNTDCDDTRATVHPGGVEVCNGLDDDCDGTVDEGVTTKFYADVDGDNLRQPRGVQGRLRAAHRLRRELH